MASGRYTVHGDAQPISTAITILELTAPATSAIEIYRAWLSQSSNTSTTQVQIRLLRKATSITGTASPPTPIPLEVGMPASGATVKWKATAEGADGNILIDDSFLLTSNWLYLPVPEERIWVPPSGIIAMKFPSAPPNANWSFGFVYREMG